jgi:hypothetical protein
MQAAGLNGIKVHVLRESRRRTAAAQGFSVEEEFSGFGLSERKGE